jgi:sulfoxide reductase heme-binding subunit YedZ
VERDRLDRVDGHDGDELRRHDEPEHDQLRVFELEHDDDPFAQPDDHPAVVSSAHVFWITSRAAGVVALLAASAAVTVGLLMSGRFGASRRGELRVVHESLSLATLVALAVHALSLLGDGFLHLSLADITIPFVSGYQRFWMAVGITGGWMLAILGLSYYARARIGVARWRSLHRFTALAWILGIAHALGQGTDAGTPLFLLGLAMVALPGLALLAARLMPRQAVSA